MAKNKQKMLQTTMLLNIPPEAVEAATTGKRVMGSRLMIPRLKPPEPGAAAPGDNIEDLRYSSLLEAIYDAVLITDLSGSILDANARALRSFGYPKPDLCKLHIADIISGAEKDLLSVILKNLALQTFVLVDAYCKRIDGLTFPTETAVSKILISREESLCFFIRDVSRRRDAEEKLRQASKMKSLHMLAGGVAHDFNNLLTSVIGHIELSLSALPPKSETSEDLATALKDARKMAELSHRMRAFSGKGMLQQSKVDLNTVLEKVADKVSKNIPPYVNLEITPSSSPLNASGESDLLESIMENLIVNAVEAIGETNGTVTISCSIENLDREFIRDHSMEEDIKTGTYACLKVSDTGHGIDEVTIETIFEPFFSTKGAGRGLGLSEVQGIVVALNGALAVETEPGKGSTFIIFLPLFTSKESESHPVATPERTTPGKGTILIVDDEPSIRRYSQRVLKLNGFTTFVADDGQQGVDMFRAHADEIDLVLLDMIMPKMNGDEALRQIRKIRSTIKVLILTGFTDTGFTDQIAGEKPTGVILKPFATDDFLNRINDALVS